MIKWALNETAREPSASDETPAGGIEAADGAAPPPARDSADTQIVTINNLGQHSGGLYRWP